MKNQDTQDNSKENKLVIEKQSIRVTRPKEGIALITIASQPLGVLRFGVKRALRAALTELEAEQHIRCLVLTGVERAFSVGSDIRDFSTEVGWLLENDFVEAELNAAIESSRLPVIAALNGYTMGGGAVLALACDIRIASESLKMGFPEVKVGAFASGSGTQRVARAVGRGRALELLMTGRTVEAREALEIGLVEFVVSNEQLLERAIELAEQIAANSAPAVSATKQCVNIGLRMGWETGLAMERDLRVKTGPGYDSIEGRDAFLEKRPPKFM